MTNQTNFSRRWMLGAGAVLAAGMAGAGEGKAVEAKGAAGGYATVDGLKVYYELHAGSPTGGKTPMVLLHGGVQSIETALIEDIIPRFSRTRPVIAIELQGHGHTGDRDGPMNAERMTDDVAGVLAHLGVKRAHMFGFSLGGMLSTGMAIRHPAMTASLTALSAGYRLEGMLPELVQMQRDPTHKPSAELAKLLPTQDDFAAWMAAYQRNNPKPDSFMPVMGKLNRLMAEWPGWTDAQLRGIRAPTLLVVGDNDFFRLDHIEAMRDLIPGAELAILPGTMHMNILKRGAWFEPMVEARIAKA